MEKPKRYKIKLSLDAVQDIKLTKEYILKNFKYRVYAENFSKKIKNEIKKLNPFAEAYEKTGFIIEGFPVYFKPYDTYIIFFIVDDRLVIVIRVLKERMDWQTILNSMKEINRQS